MTQTYQISEFAQLAGVTIRTLQYYDRIGLLAPSDTTDAGYRLYTPDDLLRLQQILTLKWMGFTLQEIKEILTGASFNLRDALAAQQVAVKHQIRQLQEASAALTEVLATLEEDAPAKLDAGTISTVIRGVTTTPRPEWMQRYYSDVAWTAIQMRRLSFSQEELTRAIWYGELHILPLNKID